MAWNTWKAQALERVAEAGGRFDSARWRLLDAVASLAPPAHAVVAHGARRALRRRIRLVLGALDAASGELALAASAVSAAELIALRGAALSPMMLSIHGRERHALGTLQSARVLAENAHGSVERCRGHLCAALDLLNQRCLHGLVEAERGAAHRDLEDALEFAVESEMLVITARQYIRVN